MSASPPEFPALKATPIFSAFSNFGKRVFLPNGIFFWAGLAKNATINATVGDAKGAELNQYLDVKSTKPITFFVKNISELLGAGIDASTISSYAPIAGLPDLRSKWKDWIIEKCVLKSVPNVQSLISLPVVVAGVTNAIYFTVKFFANEGETVLIADKYWENYDTIINLNLGANVDVFNTFKDGKFDVTSMVEKAEAVGKKQGKVILLLNFPNNPTGYAPSTTEMTAIADTLVTLADRLQKPVVVMIDDAYEGYVYDKAAEKRSLFAFLLDKHPMIIPVKMDGASKEMLFYGGRVGFVTFGFSSKWGVDLKKLDDDLNNKISGAIRGTNSNGSHISQLLVLKMLEGIATSIENRQKVIGVLSERYETFKKAGAKLHQPGKGIYWDPYNGGFFAFLNLPKTMPADQFAKKLLDEQKVGTIPVVTKAGVNGIRIAYCSMPVADIAPALDKIAALLK
ncbi:MAG: aminotransferase class I/II-fold pyridoxal phosphate-dependent enzyme [Candidatus Lokiarchaeota archaeon]|nr:aminotransferase class I/II-fold pyridoxal phosphate-dependent enzyme [Candidatus Lokiarchaeota archaeon]